MIAASWPRSTPRQERLLLVDPEQDAIRVGTLADLPQALRKGDLLVLNDAATFPASLQACTDSGAPLEVRLSRELSPSNWEAVLFGAGSWRDPTEARPPPPHLEVGDRLQCGPLFATIQAVSQLSPRLVELSFDRSGEASWAALYRVAKPVQYSYLSGPLPLDLVQNRFGGPAWSAELPSAGRPLGFGLLAELRAGGVALARLTHGAGLSSTGDPALDAALPLPERYRIPAETVRALAETRARGGRVIAVGTTVVRALESCAAEYGAVIAGDGVATQVLGPHSTLRVVDGVLSGIHDPTVSHFRLLSAFAPRALLDRGVSLAAERGFLCHEYGDSLLLCPQSSFHLAA